MDLSCKDIKEHCLRTLAVFGAPSELCNFYADVIQCEFDITRTIYRLQNDLRGSGAYGIVNYKIIDDGLLAPGDLFVIQQNLIRRFNQWKVTVDKLVEKQLDVPPLRINLSNHINGSEVIKVKAGCSLKTDAVAINEGEEVVVTDVSQPNFLRVRNSSGDEGYVPALSCVLPTPDSNTLTAVERLQILLLTSWAECVRKLKTLLEASLKHFLKLLINEWNCWLNGRRCQVQIGSHLQKLTGSVSTRPWQSSTELIRIHRYLCRIESELLELGATSNGLKSMKETVTNLDKALLCYQAFNKNWRHFRKELCRANRPIKLVEEWEQLRRARRCNHFKYYELKMTVEELEQEEEVTYIGSSSSGGARSSKESVEADQMTAVKQEERKRFLVRSVVDPRNGEKISLRDAVAAGIVDYSSGRYINPDTGEGIPIAEAMKSGSIAVDYTSIHRSTPVTDVVSLLTVRRLIVDDSYTVTAALDAETALRVPVMEAVHQGIIDLNGSENGCPEFVNSLTGARLPLDEAIEDGWVFAEFNGSEPRYSTAIHEVIGVVDRGGRCRFRSSGPYHRDDASGVRGPAVANFVSFRDAIRNGMLDSRTGDYIDSATGRRVFVAEAIRQGLIKTRLVHSTADDSKSRRGPIIPLPLTVVSESTDNKQMATTNSTN